MRFLDTVRRALAKVWFFGLVGLVVIQVFAFQRHAGSFPESYRIDSQPQRCRVYQRQAAGAFVDARGQVHESPNEIYVGTTPGPIAIQRPNAAVVLRFSRPGYTDLTRTFPAGAFSSEERTLTQTVRLQSATWWGPLYSFVSGFPTVPIAIVWTGLFGVLVYRQRQRHLLEQRAWIRMRQGNFQVGDQFGDYLLGGEVGQGGMARVYRAHPLSNPEQQLALKILHPDVGEDQEALEKFREEVNICRQLQHPNLVHLYDWGEYLDRQYLVMEFVEGRTLTEVLEQERPEQEQIFKWLFQVGSALLEIHKLGILHRDVKPSNVLIDAGNRAKLLDFGIALKEGVSGTQMVGTPGYMPPEQIQGHSSDWRGDYYSLSALAYFCLSGGLPPFPGRNPIEVINKQLKLGGEPWLQDNIQVPVAVKGVLARWMSVDPEQRGLTEERLALKIMEKWQSSC